MHQVEDIRGQQKLVEDSRGYQRLAEANRCYSREQQRLVEASRSQQRLVESTRGQHRLAEASRCQQMLVVACRGLWKLSRGQQKLFETKLQLHLLFTSAIDRTSHFFRPRRTSSYRKSSVLPKILFSETSSSHPRSKGTEGQCRNFTDRTRFRLDPTPISRTDISGAVRRSVVRHLRSRR